MSPVMTGVQTPAEHAMNDCGSAEASRLVLQYFYWSTSIWIKKDHQGLLIGASVLFEQHWAWQPRGLLAEVSRHNGA